MMGLPTIGQGGIPIIPSFGGLWENPHMQKIAEILPLRLQERLDTLGKTKRAVSIAIGAHAGYVRDLLDPDRFNVPSAVRLEALARELDTTTDYLLGKADIPDRPLSDVLINGGGPPGEINPFANLIMEQQRGFHGREPDEPGIPLVGTGDCADLVVEDDSGHQVTVERSSFDPEYHVEYLARPPALRGDRDAYAIYFQGSSMEPRYYAGEVAIVQPSRPAGPGDFVVVQLTNGEGPDVVSVLVKRLVRSARDYVELEQFNPPMIFRIDRHRVARVHRIIPPTDLLFR